MSKDIKTLIAETEVLKDSTRELLLGQLSGMSPTDQEKLRALLEDAEKKLAAAQNSFLFEKNKIESEYLKNAEDCIRHQIPNAMRQLEANDHSHEDPDQLLSSL